MGLFGVWKLGKERFLGSDIFISPTIYFQSENCRWPKKDSWLFGVFEKVTLIIWGLRKLLDISTPVAKAKEFSPGYLATFNSYTCYILNLTILRKRCVIEDHDVVLQNNPVTICWNQMHHSELKEHCHVESFYRPIFDVVTTWHQGDWCIMADLSKIRINNSMIPNFFMKVDYTL